MNSESFFSTHAFFQLDNTARRRHIQVADNTVQGKLKSTLKIYYVGY